MGRMAKDGRGDQPLAQRARISSECLALTLRVTHSYLNNNEPPGLLVIQVTVAMLRDVEGGHMPPTTEMIRDGHCR